MYNGNFDPWVSPISEKRFGKCPVGTRSCGDGLCIKTSEKCPITEILLIPKNQTVDPKYTVVDFDEKTWLGYTNGDTAPVTQVKLELGQPCFTPGFQSGLYNEHNDIYQVFERNFFWNFQTPTFSADRRYGQYGLMFIEKKDTFNPEPRLDYKNKCPEKNGVAQDALYADKGMLPISLKDIYKQNGVEDIMKSMRWFD
jgi:hypothetical protein